MDKNYWNNYYRVHANNKNIVEQSSFAKFCLNNFFSKKNLNIVELGSGICFLLRYSGVQKKSVGS